MDLGSVDRITADAIGEPGMRTFYLQARAGEQLVTVIVEKEQVELLARSVLELATEVPIPDDVEPEELSLEEPVDPRWRVGRLSIGFDDEQDRFLLEIDEFVPEKLYLVMRRAAAHYTDDKFKAMISSVPALDAADRRHILGN